MAKTINDKWTFLTLDSNRAFEIISNSKLYFKLYEKECFRDDLHLKFLLNKLNQIFENETDFYNYLLENSIKTIINNENFLNYFLESELNLKTQKNGSNLSDSNFISLTDFEDIELYQHVIGANVPNNTYVIEIINSGVYLNNIIPVEQSNIIFSFHEELQDFFNLNTYDTNENTILLKEIFYELKHGTVNNFFRDNWEYFVPEWDKNIFKKKPKVLLYIKALFSEMDKFAEKINQIYNLKDVDNCPVEYLDYLAADFGYSKEDYNINQFAFREIIRNIIEIYQRKGTNYAYTLFFKLIGFNCNVEEFWFDRRWWLNNIGSNNDYTENSDLLDFRFYLQPDNPIYVYNPFAEQKSNGIYNVNPGDIQNLPDLKLFQPNNYGETLMYLGWYIKEYKNGKPIYEDLDTLSREEENNIIEPVLNWTRLENGNLVDMTTYQKRNYYKYFKTNYLRFTIQSFKKGLSSDDNSTITRYINYLLPIWILKDIIAEIIPFEEYFNLTFDTWYTDTGLIKTSSDVENDTDYGTDTIYDIGNTTIDHPLNESLKIDYPLGFDYGLEIGDKYPLYKLILFDKNTNSGFEKLILPDVFDNGVLMDYLKSYDDNFKKSYIKIGFDNKISLKNESVPMNNQLLMKDFHIYVPAYGKSLYGIGLPMKPFRLYENQNFIFDWLKTEIEYYNKIPYGIGEYNSSFYYG